MKYAIHQGGERCVVYGYEPKEYISSYLNKGTFYEQPLLDYIDSKYGGKISDVVDVGANIGNHSVFFYEIMAINKITAFEPNPENYRRLVKSAPFATTHQIALSNKSGTVSSIPHPTNMGASYCTDGGDIKCATLDSFELSPQLVKIDAEGMECAVLEGARETIKKHRPIMFVEHNDMQHLYEFNRILQDTGVEYRIKPFVAKTWEVFEYIPA